MPSPQGYIASTGDDLLPKSHEFSWFNLSSTRLAPYHELQIGDPLYPYDPAP
jgi:hypothetical protein